MWKSGPIKLAPDHGCHASAFSTRFALGSASVVHVAAQFFEEKERGRPNRRPKNNGKCKEVRRLWAKVAQASRRTGGKEANENTRKVDPDGRNSCARPLTCLAGACPESGTWKGQAVDQGLRGLDPAAINLPPSFLHHVSQHRDEPRTIVHLSPRGSRYDNRYFFSPSPCLPPGLLVIVALFAFDEV